MKKRSILISALFLVSFVSPSVWAYSDMDERLDPEDEATIAACQWVNRDDRVFQDDYDKPTSTEALRADWRDKLPSHDFSRKVKNISNPKSFEYRSAFCEEALHRIVMEMGGGSSFIKPRCEALARDHEFFLPEYRGDRNDFAKQKNKTIDKTPAERYWCDRGRKLSLLAEIGCKSIELRRIVYDQDSDEYEEALESLKRRCEPYLGRPDVSRRRPRHRDPDDDRPSDGRVVDRDRGPIVIPRYITRRPGMHGCGNANIIINKPSTTYTLMTGLIAGLGAYWTYKGASKVDEYNYNLSKEVIAAYKSVGAVPMFVGGAGTFWGQNGMYPYPGGQMGGGMCGYPPMNTAYTGCMGGMPGGIPMGLNYGGCPGGNCGGIHGQLCQPGMPCGGGRMQMCSPGVMCGSPMCPSISMGMCQMGSAGQYPYNYMNNPAMMAHPNHMMNNYNPSNLDYERERLRQMQQDLERRNREIAQAQRYAQDLGKIRDEMNNLNNRYNSALNGYNGILANVYGPGHGNSGMYRGPGAGAMGGCGMGSGVNCACTAYPCYPGQTGAYYAPPYVVGNSGYGYAAYGYPTRNHFSIGFGWTARAPARDTLPVR